MASCEVGVQTATVDQIDLYRQEGERVLSKQDQLEVLHQKLAQHIFSMITQQDMLQNYLNLTRSELDKIKYESDNLKSLLSSNGESSIPPMLNSPPHSYQSPKNYDRLPPVGQSNISISHSLRITQQFTNAHCDSPTGSNNTGSAPRMSSPDSLRRSLVADQQATDITQGDLSNRKAHLPRRKDNNQSLGKVSLMLADGEQPNSPDDNAQVFGREGVYGSSFSREPAHQAPQTLASPTKRGMMARDPKRRKSSNKTLVSLSADPSARANLGTPDVPNSSTLAPNSLSQSIIRRPSVDNGGPKSRVSGKNLSQFSPYQQPQGTPSMTNRPQSNGNARSPATQNKSIKIKIGKLQSRKNLLVQGSQRDLMNTASPSLQVARRPSILNNKIEAAKNHSRKNTIRRITGDSSGSQILPPDVPASASIAQQSPPVHQVQPSDGYQLQFGKTTLQMPVATASKKYPSPRMSNNHIDNPEEFLKLPRKAQKLVDKRQKMKEKNLKQLKKTRASSENNALSSQ